jgi:aryl-alcohol dehydrogenase-like predicted oxidoreductase
MEYRTLGRTGLKVSEIGLGTSQTFRVVAREDESLSHRIVNEALDRGINFFDTAPSYGNAEEALGRALAHRRSEAIIATKVGAPDAGAARTSIERSFERLKVDTIDLLQIHSLKAWREVGPVLEEYRNKGRVRFIGLTSREPSAHPEMMEAMRTGAYDTVQIYYSLAERSCTEELLPLAAEMNIGVIVLRALLGLLAVDISQEFNGSGGEAGPGSLLAANERGAFEFLKPLGVATPGQALLKYVLAHPAVSTVIPATSKVERIAENVAASDGVTLPPEALRRLEALVEFKKS